MCMTHSSARGTAIVVFLVPIFSLSHLYISFQEFGRMYCLNEGVKGLKRVWLKRP